MHRGWYWFATFHVVRKPKQGFMIEVNDIETVQGIEKFFPKGL